MNSVEGVSPALLLNRQSMRPFVFGWLTPFCVTTVFAALLCPIYVTAQEPARLLAISESPSPVSIAGPDDISRWIEELGHDAFTVRQSAASRLLTAGMSAREPLLAIIDGPDPEKRAAARRLVALIDRSEFHRRLEAFAADTAGRQHLTLPGWDQYQKLVGSDPAARALFVDMQRHEGALISAMFGASKQAPSRLLESRLMRLMQWQNLGGNRSTSPPLGSSATLLFLGSVAEIEVSDEAETLIELLLQRSPYLETLRSDNRQDATRRLAVAWLLNCPTKNENILQQRLNIISTVALEEALPLPLAIISGDAPYKRTQPDTRARAALLVGQFGQVEHVDRLEPLLADTSLCNRLQQQLPGQSAVQVRDVALVVMLQLTGQRPADYGYIHARLQPPKSFQLETLHRENDQQRVEAIAKWRQSRTANKNSSQPAASK
jgi:hypothetical protein